MQFAGWSARRSVVAQSEMDMMRLAAISATTTLMVWMSVGCSARDFRWTTLEIVESRLLVHVQYPAKETDCAPRCEDGCMVIYVGSRDDREHYLVHQAGVVSIFGVQIVARTSEAIICGVAVKASGEGQFRNVVVTRNASVHIDAFPQFESIRH